MMFRVTGCFKASGMQEKPGGFWSLALSLMLCLSLGRQVPSGGRTS